MKAVLQISYIELSKNVFLRKNNKIASKIDWSKVAHHLLPREHEPYTLLIYFLKA